MEISVTSFCDLGSRLGGSSTTVTAGTMDFGPGPTSRRCWWPARCRPARWSRSSFVWICWRGCSARHAGRESSEGVGGRGRQVPGVGLARSGRIVRSATIVCQTADEAMAGFAELGSDVVLKPLFGSEGRGITRLTDEALALRAFKMLEQLGAVLYLQEYIDHEGFDLRPVGDRPECPGHPASQSARL